MYEATTDASRKSGGRCGIGFSLTKNGEQVLTYKKSVKEADSNYLEILALVHLLKYLDSMNIKNTLIKTDSLHTVERLNKYQKNKKNKCDKLFEYIDSKMKLLNSEVVWIPRKQNKVADKLSKEAAEGNLNTIDIISKIKEKERITSVIRRRKRMLLKCSYCCEIKSITKFPNKHKSRICLSCEKHPYLHLKTSEEELFRP